MKTIKRAEAVRLMSDSYMYHYENIRHTLASARVELKYLHACRESMVARIMEGVASDVVVLETVTKLVRDRGLRPDQDRTSHDRETMIMQQLAQELEALGA